jgi:ATP-dependent RNA helicase SrmB
VFNESGLHERLLKALEKLQLQQPTPVQEAVLPLAMAGKDLQVSAETGSGKTAAYLLPILHRMLERPEPATATRALILLPTRELALQVDKHCRDLASFTRITTGVLVGGTSYTEQKAMIRKNPEFIIGTPGRVLEHLRKGALLLGDLEFLVLDEADRMLDMGFRDDVMSIVQACSVQRQTFLLSATLNHGGIGRIAGEVLREPEIVAIGTHRAEHQNITQEVILADDPGHKKQLASWLLANLDYEKALVFTNMREHAEQLAKFLQQQRDRGAAKQDAVWGRKGGKAKSRVACLHGEMSQDERKRIMHWFREGAVQILVSTDLAARGLDVKGVDLVLNYELARSGDDYVHRIGRTGRAGASGLALSLIAPQEWNLKESIERYLGLKFGGRVVPGMEARFKGPAKKSAGDKAKKKEKEKLQAEKGKKKVKPKAEQRHRVKKNIGKRRAPSNPELAAQLATQAPTADKAVKREKALKPATKPAAPARADGKVVVDNAGFAPLKRR